MSQRSFERADDEFGLRINTLETSYEQSVEMVPKEGEELWLGINEFKESQEKAIQDKEDTSSGD